MEFEWETEEEGETWHWVRDGEGWTLLYSTVLADVVDWVGWLLCPLLAFVMANLNFLETVL